METKPVRLGPTALWRPMSLPMHSPFHRGHTQHGHVALVVLVLLLGVTMALLAGCESAPDASATISTVTDVVVPLETL